MASHNEKVKLVAEQVKKVSNLGVPVEFAKKSVSHFVPNPYRNEAKIPKIDLSPLNELIEIDKEAMTCTAESGITFDELARETLKKGLMPYTVSELKGITIGGAVSGCSIESMSYKYGGFHDSCIEYEVVTGSGDIITCSPEKDPDIFHMMHGSYGTLGILTQLKFKLYPAKPYVRLENRLHTNFDDYWADMQQLCKDESYLFIDGIIHSPNELAMVLGQLVDEAPYVSNYEWLDIFYKSTLKKREDYMTTHDYFFRYDTECHWLTKTFPPLEWKPVRAAVGKIFLGSTNLITWSNRLRHFMKLKKRPDVVVDVFIPSQRFKDFWEWYEKDFDFFPLWIVPYFIPEPYPWLAEQHVERLGETFMIDCAVYGKLNNDPNVDYSELLEKKVHELGGIKTLISRNHYTEDEFWSIYNKPVIDKAKSVMDPRNIFGGLYERFSPKKYGPSK